MYFSSEGWACMVSEKPLDTMNVADLKSSRKVRCKNASVIIYGRFDANLSCFGR